MSDGVRDGFDREADWRAQLRRDAEHLHAARERVEKSRAELARAEGFTKRKSDTDPEGPSMAEPAQDDQATAPEPATAPRQNFAEDLLRVEAWLDPAEFRSYLMGRFLECMAGLRYGDNVNRLRTARVLLERMIQIEVADAGR